MLELKDLLPPESTYRVYVDGSWRTALPAVAEDYFGIGGTHEGGGSIIITQNWRSQSILVIPFHTPRLPPEIGGLPSIMELLAITGGLEVLATLGLTGTIYSDCQGLIRKLLHCMYSGVTPRVPVTLSSATASPRYNTTSSNSVGRVVTRNEPTSLPTAGTNTNGVSSQQNASKAHNHQTTTPTSPRFSHF